MEAARARWQEAKGARFCRDLLAAGRAGTLAAQGLNVARLPAVNHPDFAAKLPQNDPLIQPDGLRDSRRVWPRRSGRRARAVGAWGCGISATKSDCRCRDCDARIGGGALRAELVYGNRQRQSVAAASSNLSRPDWLTYSGGKNEFALRPVTAADLVSADGQCAMPPPQPRRAGCRIRRHATCQPLDPGRHRAADDGMRCRAPRRRARAASDRHRRARRTHRRHHLYPRSAAGHLSVCRRAADFDRAGAGRAGASGRQKRKAKKAART